VTIDVPSTHTDLVERPLIATLTTIGANGLPQSTAVWYLGEEDGTFKTSITTLRQKYKNLSANPKATLFIIDPENPFRTLEVRATATLTPDPEKELIRRLCERYSTPADAILSIPGDRVIVTLTPQRIVTNG
jgi:PPOX class probable F420-dependent enzyme